jgi:hypothetical protein
MFVATSIPNIQQTPGDGVAENVVLIGASTSTNILHSTLDFERLAFEYVGKKELKLCVARPTLLRFFQGALAQLVRALPCHGRGCGFEPRRLRIHKKASKEACETLRFS